MATKIFKSDNKVVVRGEIDTFNTTEGITIQNAGQQDIKSKIKQMVKENYWAQIRKKSIATVDTTEGVEMFVAVPEDMVGYMSMYMDLSEHTTNFSNSNLEELVSYINSSLANDDQFINYNYRISNATLDGIYAQEYYPKMVDIKVEKKNEQWRITKILITKSEQVKTRNIKGGKHLWLC